MDAQQGSKRHQLTQKLTTWALGFEERRKFAHLVSRHRFALEEQRAAVDWIYLRAEMLTRQQFPELVGARRETWARVHERAFHAWSEALQDQNGGDLLELGLDLAERYEAVIRYAGQLGFRRHVDLIDALSLNNPGEPVAANER